MQSSTISESMARLYEQPSQEEAVQNRTTRRYTLLIALAAIVALAACGQANPANEQGVPDALAAFPGAQGFGTTTVGGRGGKVIEVTSLADAGPGSLRAALEAVGARIVVFRTGGTITLHSDIKILNPFVTVAGQSAPGGGISLRMDPGNTHGLIDVNTHDVVIRFLRLRQGPHTEIEAAIPLQVDNANNVVIDHCSLSWATDEVLTTYDNTADITISWNIIAEGLSHSTHYEGEHSRGLFISGDNSGRITVHHNLMAHNMRRNPEVDTNGIVDIRNNVAYDWGTHPALVSDKRNSTGANVVGNYFKAGPSTTDTRRHEIDVYTVSHGMPLYVKGNIGPHRPSDDLPAEANVDPAGRAWLVSDPVPAPSVTTTSAEQAYADVLARAGARVPALDAVDQRLLRDVSNGTGQIIDDPSQVGGWPDLDPGRPPVDSDHDGMPDAWETQHGLNPSVDDSAADRNGDGYSNIEEYLNSLAGN